MPTQVRRGLFYTVPLAVTLTPPNGSNDWSIHKGASVVAEGSLATPNNGWNVADPTTTATFLLVADDADTGAHMLYVEVPVPPSGVALRECELDVLIAGIPQNETEDLAPEGGNCPPDGLEDWEVWTTGGTPVKVDEGSLGAEGTAGFVVDKVVIGSDAYIQVYVPLDADLQTLHVYAEYLDEDLDPVCIDAEFEVLPALPLPDPSSDCDPAPRLIVCDSFTWYTGQDLDGLAADIGGIWTPGDIAANLGRLIIDSSDSRRVRQSGSSSVAWFCHYYNDEPSTGPHYDVYATIVFVSTNGEVGLLAGYDPVTGDYGFARVIGGSPAGWNVGYGQQGTATETSESDAALSAGQALQMRLSLRATHLRVFANRGGGWYLAAAHAHGASLPAASHSGILIGGIGADARLDDFRMVMAPPSERRRGYSVVY